MRVSHACVHCTPGRCDSKRARLKKRSRYTVPMQAWTIMMQEVLAVFAVALVGFIARRRGILTEAADRSLLRLIIAVLVPCLIFDKMIGNPALQHAENVIFPPLVGFGTLVLGFAVAWVCSGAFRRWLGLQRDAQRRTYTVSVGLYNYGYVPIPLALALFDRDALGVLFVHNLGIEIGIWTIGVIIFTGGLQPGWWKHVLNPPVFAIAISLAINAMGIHEMKPTLPTNAMLTTIEMLSVCAIPTALLLIGATVADHWREANLLKYWRIVASASVLRCAMLPAAFLGIAWLAQGLFSQELLEVMVIEAAMPAATFPIVLSRLYHGDAATAVQITLGTSLVGLVSIPLWLSSGVWLLGLTVTS